MASKKSRKIGNRERALARLYPCLLHNGLDDVGNFLHREKSHRFLCHPQRLPFGVGGFNLAVIGQLYVMAALFQLNDTHRGRANVDS